MHLKMIEKLKFEKNQIETSMYEERHQIKYAVSQGYCDRPCHGSPRRMGIKISKRENRAVDCDEPLFDEVNDDLRGN